METRRFHFRTEQRESQALLTNITRGGIPSGEAIVFVCPVAWAASGGGFRNGTSEAYMHMPGGSHG